MQRFLMLVIVVGLMAGCASENRNIVSTLVLLPFELTDSIQSGFTGQKLIPSDIGYECGRYVGFVDKEGRPNGSGKITCEDGRYVYEGGFSHGVKDGAFTVQKSDGSTMQGNYIKGEFDGTLTTSCSSSSGGGKSVSQN